MQYNLGLKRIF